MDFADLEALRRELTGISEAHVPSLKHYLDPVSFGYRHKFSTEDGTDFSKASTATCVLSLVRSGKWAEGPSEGHAADLANTLLRSEWRSADLDVNNPFTVAFLLEAVTALEQA